MLTVCRVYFEGLVSSTAQDGAEDEVYQILKGYSTQNKNKLCNCLHILKMPQLYKTFCLQMNYLFKNIK